MAIRNILKIGDETLRKKSRKVEKIDARILQLLEDMADTLKRAQGVGLAAPQIGVLKRVVIIDVGNGIIELINPEIIATEGGEVALEGCLSMPGKYGEVKRPTKVTVTYTDRHGKQKEMTGEGLLARAFCHETDHLNGDVFSDKVIRWRKD